MCNSCSSGATRLLSVMVQLPRGKFHWEVLAHVIEKTNHESEQSDL